MWENEGKENGKIWLLDLTVNIERLVRWKICFIQKIIISVFISNIWCKNWLKFESFVEFEVLHVTMLSAKTLKWLLSAHSWMKISEKIIATSFRPEPRHLELRALIYTIQFTTSSYTIFLSALIWHRAKNCFSSQRWKNSLLYCWHKYFLAFNRHESTVCWTRR